MTNPYSYALEAHRARQRLAHPEAPMTNQFSPAANAVWEAFNQNEAWGFVSYRDKLAAALWAVADQVVPHRDTPLLGDDASYADWNARDDVRDQLLGIAAELEGADG